MAERRSPSPDPPDPKRRRLASPSPPPVPTSGRLKPGELADRVLQTPKHRIGFHRSLQEDTLSRVVWHRVNLSAAENTLRDAEEGIADVRKKQLEHAEHVRDQLNIVNATLQRANTLTVDSRRLGQEAATIGNDISTLTTRLGDWLRREIYKKQALGEGRGVVLLTHDEDAKLASMTDDILDSELFRGLLTAIDLPDPGERDPHEEWDDALAAFSRIEDAHPISENWGLIFDLYDMDSPRGFDPAKSIDFEWPLPDECYVETAKRDHEPRSDDELLVKAGDRILLRKRFTDFWGFGSVISDDWKAVRTGFFPIICFDIFRRNTPSAQTPEQQVISDAFAHLLSQHVSERSESLSAAANASPSALLDATARYRAFRTGMSALLRRVAAAQLRRLTEMHELLAELGRHAAQTRAAHVADAEIEEALAEELGEWQDELYSAERRRPVLQRRLEEDILTLVILSQGR
ncbi:hypothetical protein JCM10450v2_003945 [Rhodotorula kratochvilovae]